MSKLTILGGSSAGVGTGQGCSSYLVTTADANIVMDMGPNTLLELRKHTDFRKLDAIIISHLHLDHVLDLFALRFALAYNPIKAPTPIPLFLPPGGLAFLQKAAEVFATDDADIPDYFTAVFEMREYDPCDTLLINGITVSFHPTVHLIPCWAMRLHPQEGGDLVFTADTGTDANLSDFVQGAALLIADSAAPLEAPAEITQRVHMNALGAAELATEANCPHLVLSHQWEEYKPLENAARAREVYDGRVSVATPGLKITW